MRCLLMHRRIPVAFLELDDATGAVKKIGEILAPEHLPIGVPVRKGRADRTAFNAWWTDRSIPASRIGMGEALGRLGAASPSMLTIQSFGLSLSDQYWIKPEDSTLAWDDVNFFFHSFSDDVGDVLFGVSEHAADLVSPDNTTDGFLRKRWRIADGKRCLIKGGSDPFCQQPFGEVIATEIMARLGIPHVPYRLIWERGEPYSVCEDFIGEDTELIPAWRVMLTQKKSNSTSVYQHFVKCCESLGVRGIESFLDRMITLDYIVANEDRHFNNFGLVRNAETLEWIGMAPIYDSGSCLGYGKLPAQILSERDVVCKPFKNRHIDQLRLVRSFDWLDLSRLDDVEDLIRGVFSQDREGKYMDEYRIRAIVKSVERRIGSLERIVRERQTALFGQDFTSTKNDVKENVAEDYSPRRQSGKADG